MSVVCEFRARLGILRPLSLFPLPDMFMKQFTYSMNFAFWDVVYVCLQKNIGECCVSNVQAVGEVLWIK